MLNNTLTLNFGYLKIILILHLRDHSKVIEHTLKIAKEQVCLYSWINHNENKNKNER